MLQVYRGNIVRCDFILDFIFRGDVELKISLLEEAENLCYTTDLNITYLELWSNYFGFGLGYKFEVLNLDLFDEPSSICHQ